MGIITKSFRNAADQVREMRISIDCGTFRIEEAPGTEEVLVEADYEMDNRLDCHLDGGILWLSYRVKKSRIHHGRTEIRMRIPSGWSIKAMEMELGVGSAQLRMAEFSVSSLKLEVGAGKCGVAQIKRADQLSVEVGTGEIHLDGIMSDTVSAHCGVGQFQMKGRVEKGLTVDCGMGQCEIGLNGKEEDYSYNLSCGMGSIRVNGASAGQFISKSHVDVNQKAKGIIRLDCGMGSIHLTVA